MLFGNPSLDPRFALATVDPVQREQLAQLFANNVRDPKLTEFLLGQGGVGGGTMIGRHPEPPSGYASSSEDERTRYRDGEQDEVDVGQPSLVGFGHPAARSEFSGTVRDLSELYFRGQRMMGGDGGIVAPLSDGQLDMDSAESSSELSMTMSPDGRRKSDGEWMETRRNRSRR